ncbi:MAG TPA: FMN reductase, partial [Burkholderiales bacterium]
GGLRGLPQLRAIMQTLGVLVLPQQYALARAHEAFDVQGRFNDPRAHASVAGIAQRLVETMRALAPTRQGA